MFRTAVLLLLCTVALTAADPLFGDLDGASQNPFQSASGLQVLLFVRTDCPITNRYAPELARIAAKTRNQAVRFWLIYPDRTETPGNVRRQLDQYHLPGTALFDPQHQLVRRAHAQVAPEAAVFDASGKLVYHGRIDNRWVDAGKSRASATVHDLENAIAATLRGQPVQQPETRAVGCSLADVE